MSNDTNNPFQEISERLIRIESDLSYIRKGVDSSKGKPLPDLTGIEGAMEITKKKKSTIYGLVCRLRIPVHKKQLKGKLYFSRRALQEWIENGCPAPDPEAALEKAVASKKKSVSSKKKST